MNLKESFRYQNFLRDLANETMSALAEPRNILKTTQLHQKKKANPEAEDEPIDLTSERKIPCNADVLVGFLAYLTEEREKLTDAISAAKRTCEVDFDAEIAKNKNRQRVAATLARLSNTKESTTTRKGTGYKFSNDGVQTAYYYDILEESKLDFNAAGVKKIAREMTREADRVSTELDKITVGLAVPYDPAFSVNDTFEDALTAFMNF